jgi:hypothetical protein
MGRQTLSENAYYHVTAKAAAAGSSTYAGEEREKKGEGLHELVDPAGHGLIRRSLTWLEPHGDQFLLLRGVAILKEDLLDTTGSMEDNVKNAMNALPIAYKLLAQSPNAVLGRYDTQIITSIFGDSQDRYILNRSQAEMDERIAEQMTYMFPEGGGCGNGKEDPQYGLFGAAYLTSNSINNYGLKGYHFTISDEPVPNYIEHHNLVRVYGPEVYQKVAENGFSITEKTLPTTGEAVTALLKRAHAFFLQINDRSDTYDCWKKIYGQERIVMINNASLLPYYEAAIIGLTEGTLTLATVADFLVEDGNLHEGDAKMIQRAVANIPIGAQAELENFDKIPLKGSIFETKSDLWPVESVAEEVQPKAKSKKAERKSNKWK